jgi:hypothetical protein
MLNVKIFRQSRKALIKSDPDDRTPHSDPHKEFKQSCGSALVPDPAI